MNMKRLDLDRYAGHTPGPWRRVGDHSIWSTSGAPIAAAIATGGRIGEKECNFILLADAPLLLAELRQVRAERDQLLNWKRLAKGILQRTTTERDALREAAEVVLDGVQNWSGDEEDGVGSLEVAIKNDLRAAALHALRAALEESR
jgi:hypothetical protein